MRTASVNNATNGNVCGPAAAAAAAAAATEGRRDVRCGAGGEGARGEPAPLVAAALVRRTAITVGLVGDTGAKDTAGGDEAEEEEEEDTSDASALTTPPKPSKEACRGKTGDELLATAAACVLSSALCAPPPPPLLLLLLFFSSLLRHPLPSTPATEGRRCASDGGTSISAVSSSSTRSTDSTAAALRTRGEVPVGCSLRTLLLRRGRLGSKDARVGGEAQRAAAVAAVLIVAAAADPFTVLDGADILSSCSVEKDERESRGGGGLRTASRRSFSLSAAGVAADSNTTTLSPEYVSDSSRGLPRQRTASAPPPAVVYRIAPSLPSGSLTASTTPAKYTGRAIRCDVPRRTPAAASSATTGDSPRAAGELVDTRDVERGGVDTSTAGMGEASVLLVACCCCCCCWRRRCCCRWVGSAAIVLLRRGNRLPFRRSSSSLSNAAALRCSNAFDVRVKSEHVIAATVVLFWLLFTVAVADVSNSESDVFLLLRCTGRGCIEGRDMSGIVACRVMGRGMDGALLPPPREFLRCEDGESASSSSTSSAVVDAVSAARWNDDGGGEGVTSGPASPSAEEEDMEEPAGESAMKTASTPVGEGDVSGGGARDDCTGGNSEWVCLCVCSTGGEEEDVDDGEKCAAPPLPLLGLLLPLLLLLRFFVSVLLRLADEDVGVPEAAGRL